MTPALDSRLDAALDFLAGLVLENGTVWGAAASAVQWGDARAILSMDSTPYHYVTRSRGYSKTTDLGAIALAVMHEQLPAGSRLYALAADRDQGRLLLDTIASFAARTPALRGVVQVDAYRVTSRNGCVLDVLAADVAGSWGLRPAFIVIDEIAQWATTAAPRALWQAVTSAMVKLPGSRMVVLTSAGEPSHWSYKVLEDARRDPLWSTSETPGPPPWADPARLDEQRRRLPASVYARLFENRWQASEDRLTTLADLRACLVLPGPSEPARGVQYVIGVDLGVRHDRTVAAVAHAERIGVDTVACLDRMNVWQGSPEHPVDLGEVEAWLLAASRAYAHAHLVADPWQSIGMCQRLRAAGVRVTEHAFTAQSVGRLATTLHLAIREHRLCLYDAPGLVDELAAVRLRETSTPGVLRMDHDPDKHDDRAIALALAVQELVGAPLAGYGFATYMRQTSEARAAAQAAPDAPEPGRRRATTRRQRCPGHLYSPETRLCHVCGEAAPDAPGKVDP
jgi:phage terminase large subunit-like protein